MPKLKALNQRYQTPAQKEEYVKNLFSAIDTHYDFMNRFMSLGLDQSWRRRAVRLANFSTTALLLDVAAGSGDSTRAALTVLPNARMIGLDFCAPLLSLARQKFEKLNGRCSVHWLQGNALQLPFADDSFDGVLTNFSLRNVTDVRQLFSEFYRVTQKGGTMVSLEMVRQTKWLQRLIFEIHFKRIVPRLGQLISSYPEAYSYLPLSIENFYSADELKNIIAAAGWQNVSYQPMMLGFVVAHLGKKL